MTDVTDITSHWLPHTQRHTTGALGWAGPGGWLTLNLTVLYGGTQPGRGK